MPAINYIWLAIYKGIAVRQAGNCTARLSKGTHDPSARPQLTFNLKIKGCSMQKVSPCDHNKKSSRGLCGKDGNLKITVSNKHIQYLKQIIKELLSHLYVDWTKYGKMPCQNISQAVCYGAQNGRKTPDRISDLSLRIPPFTRLKPRADLSGLANTYLCRSLDYLLPHSTGKPGMDGDKQVQERPCVPRTAPS